MEEDLQHLEIQKSHSKVTKRTHIGPLNLTAHGIKYAMSRVHDDHP